MHFRGLIVLANVRVFFQIYFLQDYKRDRNCHLFNEYVFILTMHLFIELSKYSKYEESISAENRVFEPTVGLLLLSTQ